MITSLFKQQQQQNPNNKQTNKNFCMYSREIIDFFPDLKKEKKKKTEKNKERRRNFIMLRC